MIEVLVEQGRRARNRFGSRRLIPPTRGGGLPDGGQDFVRLAMAETGCCEAVAVAAVRLIVRRRRPRLGHLRGYLARFSRVDRLHWINLARWLDPAAAISELAAGWALSPSQASPAAKAAQAAEAAQAGRARALAARAFARAERERVGGLELLDAELERLAASSPQAASVMASVGRDLNGEGAAGGHPARICGGGGK